MAGRYVGITSKIAETQVIIALFNNDMIDKGLSVIMVAASPIIIIIYHFLTSRSPTCDMKLLFGRRGGKGYFK